MAEATMYELKAETELRIELGGNDDQTYEVVTIQLLSGSAEVFGVPLAEGRSYSWGQGDSFAVFTWYGCKLNVSGLKNSMVYISDETPLLSFVNTHAQLEARRDHAASVLLRASKEGELDGGKYTGRTNTIPPNSNDDVKVDISSTSEAASPTILAQPLISGPRVLVCGPMDSGKSAFCSYLSACAARVGRSPLFVELDPSMCSLGVPGSLSVGLVDAHTLSVNEGLEHVHPLTFWYGNRCATDNPKLFEAQLKRLSDAINARLVGDDATSSAGLIINTPSGFDTGSGVDMLHSCIKSLSVDVVLVLGHDRLYQQLRASYPAVDGDNTTHKTKNPVTVIKLPKSGGVVNRDGVMRKVLESRKVKEYFYGPRRYPSMMPNASTSTEGGGVTASTPPALKPFLMELSQEVVKIWRYVDDSGGGGGLVPVTGSAHIADPCRLELVSAEDKSILHSLAAVMHPISYSSDQDTGVMSDEFDEEAEEAKLVAQSNAAGFVVIQSVNNESKTISLLAPCAGKLPSTNIIISDGIKWMDT